MVFISLSLCYVYIYRIHSQFNIIRSSIEANNSSVEPFLKIGAKVINQFSLGAVFRYLPVHLGAFLQLIVLHLDLKQVIRDSVNAMGK